MSSVDKRALARMGDTLHTRSMPNKTVNIRIYRKTRNRLKVAAIRAGVSMMELIDQLSR